MPAIPAGSGQHPVTLVVISANDLAGSSAFYSSVFGWTLMPLSKELTGVGAPAGPIVALRANVPAGFPGIVPYIGVSDVDDAMAKVMAAGGAIEKAPWKIPGMGTLARFTDTNGTVYGVTTATSPMGTPLMPMPFGDNPKPPAGSVCSLEMYTKDANGTAIFTNVFGWGTLPTMPAFIGFNPGAGIGGVFQSHTPTLPAVAYIYVNDVRATLAAIDSTGGKRQGDPMSMPGMATFGYFSDPSGTTMGLIGG